MTIGSTDPATRRETGAGRSANRPRLRAVPAAGPRPGGRVFVALIVLVLAAGLVGLLLLNTAMQRSAFRLEDLQRESAALAVRGEVLDTQVERLRAPDRLARAATRLGMVAMTEPVFLRLSDGRVLGDPQPAAAAPPPIAEPVPHPQAAPPRVADPRPPDPASSGGRG